MAWWTNSHVNGPEELGEKLRDIINSLPYDQRDTLLKMLQQEKSEREGTLLILDKIRQRLINEGHINRLELYDDRAVLWAASVKLPNGWIWIAVSNCIWDSERGKNLEIFDENGRHLMYISEPELLKSLGTPGLKLCSDGECLYVGSYNTNYSYIAAYQAWSFKRKWKVPMGNSRIQSIALDGNEIAVFDMETGKIKFFNKENGMSIEWKDINTKNNNSISHINLASMRIAAIPELEAWVNKGINDFCNKLQIFNDKLAKRLAWTSLSSIISSRNPIAVDEKKGRVYMAIENMIGIFDTTGCIGIIPETTRSIKELDFDSQTNCLLVSMLEGKWKVEAFDAEAINEFIKKSNWTNKQLSE